MVAIRLGPKRAMKWVNYRLGCVNTCRKRYSYPLGGSFLEEKAAWAMIGYLPTENADYYMLINEWAWLRSRVWLLRLKVQLGSVLESELRQK